MEDVEYETTEEMKQNDIDLGVSMKHEDRPQVEDMETEQPPEPEVYRCNFADFVIKLHMPLNWLRFYNKDKEDLILCFTKIFVLWAIHTCLFQSTFFFTVVDSLLVEAEGKST